jgi:predicted nucleic acid-binding protein
MKKSSEILVLDASIAAKWYVKEDYSLKAREYLLQIQENPQRFFAPELFYIEMLSVLSKYTSTASELANKVNLLHELGINRSAHSAELISEASSLCLTYKLSAYDATYAALAKLCHGTWITADEKAHKKIKQLNISRCLY